MEEKDRVARAVSTVLDADVLVRPAADGTHALRVIGLPRQPRFRAAWVRRGWPGDVRARLERSPAVTLVVAPELSSGARQLLDERAINWVDETGAANLRGEGLLVHVDRAPAPTDPRPRSLLESDGGARRRGDPLRPPRTDHDRLDRRTRRLLNRASQSDPHRMGPGRLDRQAGTCPRTRGAPCPGAPGLDARILDSAPQYQPYRAVVCPYHQPRPRRRAGPPHTCPRRCRVRLDGVGRRAAARAIRHPAPGPAPAGR